MAIHGTVRLEQPYELDGMLTSPRNADRDLRNVRRRALDSASCELAFALLALSPTGLSCLVALSLSDPPQVLVIGLLEIFERAFRVYVRLQMILDKPHPGLTFG